MKTNDYVKLIEKSYKIFESGDVDDLDEIFDQNVIEHTPDPNFSSKKKGLEYQKEQFRIYTEAFPNGTFDIKEIMVEGDKGIAYVVAKAKNTGSFNGMPPTNKEIKLHICEIFKFKNGKISEHWQITDNLLFLTQLGLLSESEIQQKLEG